MYGLSHKLVLRVTVVRKMLNGHKFILIGAKDQVRDFHSMESPYFRRKCYRTRGSPETRLMLIYLVWTPVVESLLVSFRTAR